mmetsp:Transcript_11386/g.27456  ORF Transcript_11386/g.27456 Transcript_11386/m.27456 type:complete len:158 (+) Transcript_11386:5201-5674(+)
MKSSGLFPIQFLVHVAIESDRACHQETNQFDHHSSQIPRHQLRTNECFLMELDHVEQLILLPDVLKEFESLPRPRKEPGRGMLWGKSSSSLVYFKTVVVFTDLFQFWIANLLWFGFGAEMLTSQATQHATDYRQPRKGRLNRSYCSYLAKGRTRYDK